MVQALRTSLRYGGLRQGGLQPGLGGDSIFATSSLDLNFAKHKNLGTIVDATTGANLVDFTRQSRATYVDSEGVIRTATTNLLLRSEEFDNASWTNSASLVTANTAVAPNGTLTADTLTPDVLSLYQTFSNSIATYTSSIFVKSAGATSCTLSLVGGLAGLNGGVTFSFTSNTESSIGTVDSVSSQPFGNGWYRVTATLTATGSASPQFRLATSGGDVYIWGAQLEQSTTVGEYIPTTSTINSAPRFDHNPTTGESLGLLVEEQRTNLLVRSEEFQTGWTRGGVLAFGSGSVTDAAIAPNGTMTADLITEDTSVSSVHRVSQGCTVAAGSNTVSIYAKRANGIRNVEINANALTNARAVFDLSSGAVGEVSNGTASIQSVGNGWYRCSVIGVSAGGTSTLFIQIATDTTAASSTYTGDGTSGIYLWGAQLEAGSFPTSYIPTTTAAATRAADVASIAGSAFSSWYRQDEGTVFAEFQPRANATTGVAYLNAGSVNEATRIFYNSTISNYTFSVRAAGVEQSSINNLGAYVLQSERISAAYKVNDLAASRNGGASVSDVSAILPTGIDRLNLGTTQGPNYLNGTIRRLTYWPARLPNETLQTITQ